MSRSALDYSKWPVLALAMTGWMAATPHAQAIPAFAAQTGEPCSACHIGFPQLTPYGRLFKLEGYVAGGSVPGYKNLAGMVEAGFTYLDQKTAHGANPDFPTNHMWSVQQASLFYGGALYAPLGLGAFIQGTYDGVGHQFHWDNTDIRLARPLVLFGKADYYGVTFNNSPSLTDLWNSTPAWGYPFIPDALGPTPGAPSLQISGLAQSVYGAGVYNSLNLTESDSLYTEFDLYKSLPNHASYALNGGAASPIAGSIPYWRLALQHTWASNSFEVGTLGLIDNPYPADFPHGQSDHFVDMGVDSQLQLIQPNQAFTVQVSYIHEAQHWAASQALGNTSNLNDSLNNFTLTGSYLFHQKYGVTETYNNIYGKADTSLYNATGSANGKPNSQSFTTEVDYYPWNNGGPSIFPWVNAKLFVEGTIYPQFNGLSKNYDGNGTPARANDTLFTGIWLVF
jgi:phage shock protein PspC (stress-responsive transcriptional regulator)